MDAQLLAASGRFKSKPQDREKEANLLLPSLNAGMPQSEVRALLGPPDEIVWNFTLFYSSALTVRFDGAGHQLAVVSDVTPEAGAKADRSDPEVLLTISRFRDQPYNRREPAKKLIGFLKPGTSLQEAEAILGAPDSTGWSYKLKIASNSNLTFTFDNESRIVQSVIEP